MIQATLVFGENFPNSYWLISSVNLHLHDQFKQDWYSLIEHSPNTLNHRLYTENFEFEIYLRVLEDKIVIHYAN